MFNKIAFNKTPYDRSSLAGVPFGVSLSSVGDMSLNLLVQNQLSGQMISSGGVTCGFYTITNVLVQEMAGGSELGVTDIVLFVVPMTPPTMAGESLLDLDLVCVTDVSMEFSGDGGMTSTEIAQQIVECEIRTNSTMDASLELPTYVEGASFSGEGAFDDTSFLIPLDLTIDFDGSGDMELRRLTEIGYDTIELLGINLAPGGYIRIDTDLLTVLVNGLEDVSYVTSESVFFEVSPGDTEIKIEYDGGATVHANVIRQNRWL